MFVSIKSFLNSHHSVFHRHLVFCEVEDQPQCDRSRNAESLLVFPSDIHGIIIAGAITVSILYNLIDPDKNIINSRGERI